MSACETCQGSGLRSPVGDGCDVYRTAACPSCLGTGTTYYRPCYYCRRPRGNDHQDGCTCNTCLRDVCWGINEDCVATRAVAIETCQALANIGTGVLIAHLCHVNTDQTDPDLPLWVPDELRAEVVRALGERGR